MVRSENDPKETNRQPSCFVSFALEIGSITIYYGAAGFSHKRNFGFGQQILFGEI